ncbi:MAG: S8 family serine peptidase [Thermoplasmatales archaeon]|nr:MAG: S8 family serine peptidase [Thermoplasmatales archaeon]
MKKKLLGIFVMMLLIATALPSISSSEVKFTKYDNVQDLEFVPGEFIVKLVNDIETSRPLINQLNEKYQVSSIDKVFRNVEDTILDNIYIFSVSENSDILSIVKDYASCSGVVYAEPNYIIHPCIIPKGSSQSVPQYRGELSFSAIPNDENFSKQWALHNTGQTGGTIDADIDAPEAWDIETGNEDIIIAIPDSGVDYTHPDLADNMWINEDEIPGNGIDDDGNGFIDDVRGWDFAYDDNDPLDEVGHGTMIAGIIGAVTNNDIGIAGVCWNCKIMPVKLHNEDYIRTIANTAKGIQYAGDNGAHVVSMSIGNSQSSPLIEDAINHTYNKGAVLIAAAGNSNSPAKGYPAAYDHVIAVAATDSDDKRASFSSYGSWVDVAAPGHYIYSTMPTYHVLFNDWGREQNYYFGNGTSYSCPMVAGLAALLLSKNPSLSQEEVKALICKNVDPYNSTIYIGTGRINAFKALIAPELDLSIRGGLGLTATITNSGITDATNCTVTFTLDGGLILIPLGKTKTVDIGTVPKDGGIGNAYCFVLGFGIGAPVATVDIACHEAFRTVDYTPKFLIGPFIL